MIINTQRLGIAAYIKMKGHKLLKAEKGVFTFESDKTIDELSVDYYNSCCCEHDACVCNLRAMIRK